MTSTVFTTPGSQNDEPELRIINVPVDIARIFLGGLIEKLKFDVEMHEGTDFHDIREQTLDIEELDEAIKHLEDKIKHNEIMKHVRPVVDRDELMKGVQHE